MLDNKRDGVAEDCPGRIVRFPDGAEKLIVKLLGAQGDDEKNRATFIEQCTRFTAMPNGPARLERGECIDSSGIPTSLLIAYWPGPGSASSWWTSRETAAFWRALPVHGDIGYFVERMTIPRERFNYTAGTEDKHGSAAVFPLEPSSTFGYWGAYRDRLPASKFDSFEASIDKF